MGLYLGCEWMEEINIPTHNTNKRNSQWNVLSQLMLATLLQEGTNIDVAKE